MTEQQEAAMRLALEALEEACEIVGAAWAWRDEKGRPSITALRAALEQPAQQWTDETAKVPDHVWGMPPFRFRRFVYGQERAQDVLIEREETLERAIKKAARICPPSEMTVLVYEGHHPQAREPEQPAQHARDAITWTPETGYVFKKKPAQQEPVNEGWKLVPVEPTADMWKAVNKLDDEMAAGGYDGKGCSIEQAWICLLDAAPSPPAQQTVAVPNTSYEHRKFVLVGREWYERFAAFHDDCQIGAVLTREEQTVRQQGYENGWNDAQRYLREVQATRPQAREWVGLTDSERKEIYRMAVYVEGAITLTEAKLREKNGGAA